MAPRRDRIPPITRIEKIMKGVEGKSENTSCKMTYAFDGTVSWLNDAIQSCKRKILEGTNDSEIKPKKIKTEASDNENSNPNMVSTANVDHSAHSTAGSIVKKETPIEAPAGARKILSEFEVRAMKVEPLRTELKSRGVHTGIHSMKKKDLQECLLKLVEADKETIGAKSVNVADPVPSKSVEVAETTKAAPSAAPKLIPDDPQQEPNKDVEMEDAGDIKSGDVNDTSQRDDTMMEVEKETSPTQPVPEGPTSSGETATSNVVSYAAAQTQFTKLSSDSEAKPAPKRVVTFSSSKMVASEPLDVRTSEGVTSYSSTEAAATAETTVPSSSLREAASMQKVPSVARVSEKSNLLNENSKGGSKVPETKEEDAGIANAREANKSSSLDNKVSNITGGLAAPAVALDLKTGKSTTGSSSTSGSSTSLVAKSVQKLNANSEARAKRMAEMRGKSKPIVIEKSNAAPKAIPSFSSLLLKKIKPEGGDVDKRKRMIDSQMRAKALINKGKMIPQISSSQIPIAKTAEPSEDNQTQKSHKKQQHMATASKVLDSSKTKLVASASKLSQHASIPKEIRSPMDTYEMSDREDSDSEDESDYEDESKPKKKVPRWAQKPHLTRALEKQYLGPDIVDPDTIFHEVQSCDLEAIFGDQKKSRYKKRTSSGNWNNDRVTAKEKLAYKRNMGFSQA